MGYELENTLRGLVKEFGFEQVEQKLNKIKAGNWKFRQVSERVYELEEENG